VEKVTILFTDEVLDYLDNLIYILYQDKYFSFLENSHNYVLGIYDFIDENLPSSNIKKSPKSLQKYGDFYIFYNSNPRITWYIFFSKKRSTYLIKHITNNHLLDSSFLNLL
jgi:hypothetical protein